MYKGQNQRLVYGDDFLLEHETSSSFNINANTSDVASKSDANPMYDHQEFNNYSFDASCDGILKDETELVKIIAYALSENSDAISIGGDNDTTMEGNAFVASADFTFPSDGNSTVSISFTGTGGLES